ncbi:hypothetical protein BKA65DRAFT_486601 [Rhexocercosporidium sp. MPI-PUGE-AT-0058]|nr:hypothetical protein BKA65DRAFT_486601 [Rhexocercosporidium sp. MPI-PUGE-AT-0058]
MLDTKDIETVLELGEKITNISLGPQKEAIAKKEEDLIRERVVDITYQAMEVSNNPKELAVNMRDLFPNLTIHACWVTDTITSKIGTHPRLLLNHGLYGTTIVSCVNYIIDKVYPMFATCKISDDEKALAWCEFITCSVKLWTFTEQQLEEHKDIKAVGLQTMNDLVVDSLQGLMKRDQGFPWTFDLKVLTNATIWFVEETCWTGGDFKLVVSLAEKALPSREILRRALDEENGWKLLGHPGRESTVETLGLNFEQLKVSVEKTKEEDAITETSSASKTAMPTKPETPTPSLAQSAINGADSNGKPQLKDYGYTIGEVVRNMRPIIAKVSNPVTATSKEQLADQNNFLSCGVALWNIIHMRLTHEEQIARKGLGLMAEAILHSLVKGTVTREFGITIMHRYTLWFIEEWAKAGSDLRIVKKEALKAMPNDQVEWSGFVGRECGHSKLPTPSSKLPELALTVKTKVQTATSKTLIAQLPAITPKAKPKKSPVLKPPTYTQAPTSTPKGGVFEPTEDTLEMILEYGYTIPQVISRMETILKALSKATPSTPEYDFAEADFIECSSALWYQVQQANRPVQSKKLKTGLELLCFAILGSLNDEGMSQAVRMNLNVKCSTWFMVQWKNASGDFEKVKEEALKELPDGTEDVLLFPRSAPSLLRSRLLAAMSAELSAGIGTRVMLGKVKSIDGTDKSTTTAPQKVVASRTVAEAKFEVPTVNKQVDTGDQEDIDASHESMEYIDPSSVVSTSGSLLNKAGPEVKSTQVNAGTGALLPKRAASALDPLISKSESGTNTLPAPAPITAEIPPLVIINNNPQEQIPKEIDADNKSDNMPNNMVPPTPPMTSEELSGHLVPDSDLHAIQNTLTILSHSLEQITTALYGTRSFHKTGTDANTIIDTDFRVEFCAGAHKAGMLFATNRLSELLKDLQSEIAAMSNKIGDLDTKIDSLHKDNKELKALAQELVENLRVREEKDGGEGEKMLKMLLDEVRGLKWDVEMLAEGREKEGERDGQYRVWLEKARELQGVVERAREVGGLREVLWPQGDGGFGVGGGGVSAEVKGEGEREKGVRRELYVKIGNQAGRGQGGGGFCGIM